MRNTQALLLLAAQLGPALSFQPHLPLPTRQSQRSVDRILVPQATESPFFAADDESKEFLQGDQVEILNLSLPDHRPLGCTVEESLGERYGKVVFCSKVTPGGAAEQAGVQVGDVFIGVSGMFDDVEDVTEAGIERV